LVETNFEDCGIHGFVLDIDSNLNPAHDRSRARDRNPDRDLDHEIADGPDREAGCVTMNDADTSQSWSCPALSMTAFKTSTSKPTPS
jgi:hypothetical protein